MKNRIVKIAVGLLLALTTYWLMHNTHENAAKMAAIVVLMAFYWVTETLPLAVTSLFPIVLFPLFDILKLSDTTAFYGKPTVYLFLGGFLMAIALEKTNLHIRIALFILKMIGGKPSQLILGFMAATAFLSMWISNTAAVMVMLPIGLSIIKESEALPLSDNLKKQFAVALMIGVGYAGNVGGMATLIGTAPNMVFKEIYEERFSATFGFGSWLGLIFPFAVLFLFIIWLLLTKILFKQYSKPIINKDEIDRKYRTLGKMSQEEKLTALVFLLAVLLWLTGNDIQINHQIKITGWRNAFGLTEVKDAAVAIFCAILLFILPSSNKKTILSWQDTKELPWGILLLFGGGFAIAGGFSVSGLSDIISGLFVQLSDMPIWLVVLTISFVITFVTEIASNTAVTTLVMPILAGVATVINVNPLILMLPATLSASCAFMMPTATPPLAIVYGSNYVPIRLMNRTGLVVNLIGVVLITTYLLLMV